MKDIRAHIIVSGTVQGVCFRAYTREKALRLNLCGWVRNCPDGNVEIEVEGPDEKVEMLINWCHQGSPGSDVTGVQVERSEPIGDNTPFYVKR